VVGDEVRGLYAHLGFHAATKGSRQGASPGPGVRGSERYFSRWSHVGLMFELYLWGVVRPRPLRDNRQWFPLANPTGRIVPLAGQDQDQGDSIVGMTFAEGTEEYTTSHGRRRAPKSWRGSPRSLTRGNGMRGAYVQDENEHLLLDTAASNRYSHRTLISLHPQLKSLHPASDPFYLVLSSESWAGTSSPPRLSPMPFNHQKACVAFLFNPLCLLP